MKRYAVPDGWIAKGFTFALDPTPDQIAQFARHFGARRVAYNWALALVKRQIHDYHQAHERHLCEGGSEREWVGARRSDQVPWNTFALNKRWNVEKRTVAVDRETSEPWWQEVSRSAFSSGLKDLVAGLENWSASKRGVRKGKRMGFPRPKNRRRNPGRVGFGAATARCEPDRRHVVLPRMGRIRTCENTRRLQRLTANGNARILSATLSEHCGRYFVSFGCLVVTQPRSHRDGTVGIDLGVGATLAVVATSDDKEVDRLINLRAERVLMGPQIAAAQRQQKRRMPGSRRHKEAKWRVAKLHNKAANIRSNHAHVFTHRLAETQGTVVVEDLNVQGMALRAGMRLGRSVNDAGMGELKRQIVYKVGWQGGQVVVADRWFPSSQLCSMAGCDFRHRDLALSERVWTCPDCHSIHDRDLNAAVNLAKLGELRPGVEPTVRPGASGRVAVKREGLDLRPTSQEVPGRLSWQRSHSQH